MRFISRILIGVSLALCWTGVASADTHDPALSSDPSLFWSVTNVKLDGAFERFVMRESRHSLYGLSGPSSMNCTSAAMSNGIETCVVTTRGRDTSIPAALAHR